MSNTIDVQHLSNIIYWAMLQNIAWEEAVHPDGSNILANIVLK